MAHGRRALVVNVMGRLFMEPLDDPFRGVQAELARHVLGGPVGTPGTKVGGVFFTACMMRSIFGAGRRMSSEPMRMVRVSEKVRPYAWKNGRVASMRWLPSCSSFTHARPCTGLAMRLACVSAAPFGVPVVPDV